MDSRSNYLNILVILTRQFAVYCIFVSLDKSLLEQ